MARVAFVTGGTRGIGRAIVERLNADGLKVAAGYSGNDEVAQACARDVGVMVVKGNVGVFDDCRRAVQVSRLQALGHRSPLLAVPQYHRSGVAATVGVRKDT